MKKTSSKPMFSIRKLKVGVCSVLVAVTFVGAKGVMADEAYETTQRNNESELVVSDSASNSDLSENTTKIGETNQLNKQSKEVNEQAILTSESELNKQLKDQAVTTNSDELKDTVATRMNRDSNTSSLNVKDYGAVGDGVSDDRQAIQDTIDAAAKGLGGGKVYFPEGTYLVKEIVFLRST